MPGRRHGPIRFAIADTGIGIRADQAARSFRPSPKRTPPPREVWRHGSGAGDLQQLVEMMGGSIGVESREGQGSTFWFTAALEWAARESGPLPPAGSRSVRQPEAWHPGPAARILVTDDHAINRDVARRNCRNLDLG